MLTALLIAHALHLLCQVVHGVCCRSLALWLTLRLTLVLEVELGHSLGDSGSC
jgi:hypothetical protein